MAVSETEVEVVESTKFLGREIDELVWSCHIHNVLKKIPKFDLLWNQVSYNYMSEKV